ncbi:MAG: hypothetical protein ILP19_03715, partial [Oscillospiraceae bacterium]|nr:hypothetical protein [Oscillospiraceae bacterium]
GSSMRGARLVSFGNSSAKSRIKNILSRKNKGLIATVTAVTVIGVSSVCMLTGAAGKLSLDGITQGLVGYTQITPSSPPGDAYITYSPLTDIPELKGILKNARSAKAPVLPESYSQYNIELVSGDTTEILLHIPLVGDERTIVCEKTIQSRSAAKQRKVSVEYYTLSSKSHDRLMEFVTRSDEPFPAGHYTGTDEHYEAIVTKTDDTKQIEIIMDRIPLAVLSVPQRYGLEMTNVQGMVTAVYQGYGLFEVTSAPFSSLMIPCGFVYDGDHSETIGFTTDNELYDKAEKQMQSIVKQLINDRNYFLEYKGTTSLTGEDINYDFYNDLMSGTFIAAVYTSESEKTYMSFRFSSGGQLEYLGDTASLPDSAYLISHGTIKINEVPAP